MTDPSYITKAIAIAKNYGEEERARMDRLDSVLTDLLARLEAAEGADRELDARLYVALIARLQNPAIEQMIAERAASHPDSNVWLDGARDWQVKPFTASLDATLALVERVLPGFEFSISTARHRKGWTVKTWLSDDKYSGRLFDHKTPALALLCALVKALIAADIEASSRKTPGGDQ